MFCRAVTVVLKNPVSVPSGARKVQVPLQVCVSVIVVVVVGSWEDYPYRDLLPGSVQFKSYFYQIGP